jgi:hypothetical protein
MASSDKELALVSHVRVDGHDDEWRTPTTYQEAMDSDDAELWREAMDKEMASLSSSNVWKLAELPAGRKAVGCKWVFKIKRKADGSVDKYKARLVAQGFSQVEGFDYQETFSPVVKMTTLRTLVAVSAARGYGLYQSDVTTAFLHSNVEEEIYMKQPPGYIVDNERALVCLLLKSLYGLKQAGRNWNKLLTEFMLNSGLRQSNADPCLFLSDGSRYKKWFAVAVFVDDNIISAEDESDVARFMRDFQSAFTVEDAVPLTWCLGIKVEQGDNYVTLSQEKYVMDMLKRFDMEDCRVHVIPAEDRRLTKMDCPEEGSEEQLEMRREPYRSMIGSLNYAATTTRIDISYAVGAVCSFAENPGYTHLLAAKRILRYLKNTKSEGLMYEKNVPGDIILTGYCDADWAGDVDGRKSHGGYVFTLGSAAVSWKSKRQSVVALSSCEAEYLSLSEAAKELVWLRGLLVDMGIPQDKSVIYCDNQGAVALSKNPVDSKRTKHIDVRHHFVRDLWERGELVVEYVPTQSMPADFLTKPVPLRVLEMCKSKVMTMSQSADGFDNG